VSTLERDFEATIEAWLLGDGGYGRSNPANFDTALGLDLVELFAFLDATQAGQWVRLVERYGGADQEARTGFAKRVASELDNRGTVDVLRHGVADLNVEFVLTYFKPAHGLTPVLVARYEANRVTVTRQLPFETDSHKTVDMALLVNGIPTATAELKNPLTGQNIDHAQRQYRHDRDPNNRTLARRAVVHFAVDPSRVSMTTRLAGPATRFLPFNQGSGGAGRSGGAGNPPNPVGFRTAYLWEEVWSRDAWLDLLARYVHVEASAGGSKAARTKATTVIFPRFHQWDAVCKLEAHARGNGAGAQYLVQHSAGSGKSNTIAWLAHRLANLHDAADTKVFHKVVVITDRLVLDRQLQDTIYQFEHAHGVVERIDRDSSQLAEALSGEQAKVIITTLQKFPFVLDKVAGLPERRYAVIVDEAHSSQTGDAAKELRAVLAGAADGSAAGRPVSGGSDDESLGVGDDQALAVAEAVEAEEEAVHGDAEDLVISVAGRGRQPNLSFFAFTATPKAKTLELFGSRVNTPEGGRYVPFHLYSMRQAIAEGFIFDVLQSYTTYKTFWHIEKRVTTDPEYDQSRAKAAIARFVSLHPHNLAQKAEIVVEHFRQNTATKINGTAKAMVVTSSRLHAVRYKQAIDGYIAEQNYAGIAALVAFSGRVIDGREDFTEPAMNGFPESETAERFGGDDYQVLIVAEKFQTGFDQPLLHSMYVDKVLTGLNAVQTLSRLNRIAPGKTDTFVLDFRNETEDIQRAFAPWYEQTVAIPTDPNELWDARRRLLDFPVIRVDEILEVVKALLEEDADAIARVYAGLDPARERFKTLEADDQAEFRDALRHFTHLYSFMSQVVPFTDTELERDYLYARALGAYLPDQAGERLDLGSVVELTHLRTEKRESGSASIDQGDGEVKAIFDGKGRQHESEEAPLSTIVDALNDRFGTTFSDADQLLFDQYVESCVADPDIADQARNNSFDNFRLVFDRELLGTLLRRHDDNEDILKRILDDDEFRGVFTRLVAEEVFRRTQAA
jgi:type I restriction enzyme R subunit